MPTPLPSRAQGGGEESDDETYVIDRARRIDTAGLVRQAVGAVKRSIRTLVGILIIIGLMVGAAASSAALEGRGDSTVNVISALAVLLIPQTLLLLLWVLVMVIKPSMHAAAPLLAPFRLLLLRRRRSARTDQTQELTAERARVGAAGAVGLQIIVPRIAAMAGSTLTHAFWTACNIGAIAAMLTFFAVRQYTFVWETTILSANDGANALRVISTVPDIVGFTVPDDEVIARAERGDAGGDTSTARESASDAQTRSHDRHAFAWLLVGSLVVYGFVPRFGLWMWCAASWRRRSRRHPLDLNRPGFARVLAERAALIHAPHEPAPPPEPATLAGTPTASGANVEPNDADPALFDDGRSPIGFLAIEHHGAAEWPPVALRGDARWIDLGVAERGDDMRRALRSAAGGDVRSVLAICDLSMTPDRGHLHFLQSLAEAVRGRIKVVLSGGDALRDEVIPDASDGRSRAVHRVQVWRDALAQADIAPAMVMEFDLTVEGLASDRVREHLAGMSSSDEQSRPGDRIAVLDQSLATIAEHAERWTGTPSIQDQTLLHQQLLDISRNATQTADATPASMVGDGWAHVRMQAESVFEATRDPAAAFDNTRSFVARESMRLRDRLPPDLRVIPRYAAAGALAGACGCLAAAISVTPVAFASLPAWTAAGAAVASVIRLARSPGGSGNAASDAMNDGDALESIVTTDEAVDAAIIGVLVRLGQGAGESGIHTILRAVFQSHPTIAREEEPMPPIGIRLASVRMRAVSALRELGLIGGAS